MDSYRKTAIIVGVLYITATVAGALTALLWEPILGSDYLTKAVENENQVIIGALFYFIMAVAVAGIAIVIYPILKKHNEALAFGHAAARIVEGVFYIVGAIFGLLLITLSREYVAAGAPDASYFQTLGELLGPARDLAAEFGMLVFTLSALIFFYLLYQSKLVPLWLSLWGFFGAILGIPVHLLSLFKLTIPNIDLLYIPLAICEMALAVWLIGKGFSPQVIKSNSS